jgi:hypothetical protein
VNTRFAAVAAAHYRANTTTCPEARAKGAYKLKTFITHTRLGLSILAAVACGGLLLFGLTSTGQSAVASAGAPGGQCGVILERGAQVIQDVPAAQAAVTCFWQAYQQRQSATLVLQIMGVDTFATHTFILASSNGQYGLTDTVEFRVIPRPLGPANTYTCSALTQSADGLVATACGDEGDIIIPAPASQPGMPTTGQSEGTDIWWAILAAVTLILMGVGTRFRVFVHR